MRRTYQQRNVIFLALATVGLAAGFAGGRTSFLTNGFALNSARAEAPSEAALSGPDLVKLVAAARDKFQPIADAQVAAARAKLTAEFGKLSGKLNRNPAEVRDGWHEFLKSDSLRAQLAAESTDPTVLQEVLARYQSDKPGMEWAPVLNVRHALQDFVNLSTTAKDAKAAETYQSTIDDLLKRLEAYQSQPTPQDGAAISRALGLLRRSHQAAPVVAAVQRTHGEPNLFVESSRRLLAAGVDQDVDEQMEIQDNVLGVSLFGNVRTTGKLTMSLKPSDEVGAVDLQLTGVANSTNVGYKRSVAIYSRGVTTVSATKSLRVSDGGVADSPAQAACETSTTIDDIQAKRNFVTKMAWRKAGKSKAKAEAEASRKAEGRIEAKVDDQAADMLRKANDSFINKFQKPLVRREGFPKLMEFNSTPEKLLVRMLQLGETQLAAPTPAPAIEGSPDLSVRLHQTLVANLAEAVVGGVTLTDEKLADMLKEGTGKVPDELQISPDKDPWSITFPSEQPVSVVLDPAGITIAIQGRRFTRGDQEIRNPMRITAKYKYEKTAQGMKLTRAAEDLEVDYINIKGSQTVSQVAFRTFVRRKFEALLKPEIGPRGLTLPGKWEKAGQLELEQLLIKDGWIALGWKLPAAAPPSATKTADATTADANSVDLDSPDVNAKTEAKSPTAEAGRPETRRPETTTTARVD